MRHICLGKQPHPCKAQIRDQRHVCRCDSDRRKEKALTRGGLGLGSVIFLFLYTKKSAEVIVGNIQHKPIGMLWRSSEQTGQAARH